MRSNVLDSKKPGKQSAHAAFNTAAQAARYRSPGTVYRDWSYRPERAIKDDIAAATTKEGT